MKSKIGIFFMSAGALLIVLSLSLFLWNSAENKRADEAAEKALSSVLEAIEKNKDEYPDPYSTEMTVKEINGYDYIGYISVPSKNINLPVMSEWDYNRLKISPCRYYGSSKTDDLVIAAHNLRSFFWQILSLEPGATVIFTDMDGIVTKYTVSNVETLRPSEVERMKSGDWDLTLFTCTRGSQNRRAIRCIKVSE